MNQKHLCFFICIFFLSSFVFSQTELKIPTPKYPELFKSIPTIDTSTPEWAVLLYSSEPNVNSIETAFKKYYQDHPYTKTVHGQNYKHFMRTVFNKNYVQNDGSILITHALPKSSTNRSSKKQNDTANWNFIGPFTTYDSTGEHKRSHQANVYSMEQSLSNPNTMLAGCETGASFISTDKGESWSITADALGLSGGINAVAIDPNTDQVMYLANGNSLYKSTNKGASWKLIHHQNNLYITDISINPSNGNEIITAGTLGAFRSMNGGTSWTHIITDKCWDIERKTNDSNTVFISKTNTVTNSTEIWKSTNNGQSFSARTLGWFSPTGTKAVANQGARIGVTDADPNRLYVLLLGSDQNYADDINFLGVYKSADAGETWTLPYDGNGDGIPDNDPGGPYNKEDWCMSCFGFGNSLTGGGGYDQGFYNASIDVSDTNPDNFLVGMLSLFKSTDSGASFTPWGGYRCDGCEKNLQHPDIQEIEINGNDVWVASDGGIDKYDGDFNYIESKMDGIDATENWGFGQGWNEDIIVGGRYHNGNAAYRPSFNTGNFIRLGGGEAPTGYVSADSKVAIFSDINDKIIPENLADPVTDAIINVSMHPNQHYYNISKRSELVNDPRYNNVHYIGKDNKLWKTEDAGINYSLVHAFGNNENHLVQGIEIPRDNPDYMYVTQYLPENKNKIWKSTDAGNTWTELTKPEGDNGDYILIQVSEANRNEVYIAYANDWSDSNKIFKSTDGGNTWHNLTTNTLNRGIQHIVFQNGTDGGIYAVTYKTIYYRNNQMSDWVTYDNGLPTRKSFNKLLPFYRDSKLRGATFNRGFVETPLYESSSPVAQPLANTEYRYCSKDTVYFDDYSILKHAGAKWQWNFPGASYVSSTKVRNPKVLYSTPGNYSVSLSVTDANGMSSGKTVTDMIKFVEDVCSTETASGQALSLEQNGPNYLYTKDIELDNVTHFTMSAWIKPSEKTQSNNASIIYTQDSFGRACTLNFKKDNHLGIHWNSSQWEWDSGLQVPKNQWSYVAIVVTPNNITVYLNEQKATREYTSTVTNLGKTLIGSYNGWSSRNYDGLIDEMAIWDRALSEHEIRLKRHLIKEASDPNLKAYYQFNSILNGEVYDVLSDNKLFVSYEVTLDNSGAPVASGVSQKATVTTAQEYLYSESEVSLSFDETALPDGDVYITKMEAFPYAHEFTNELSENYWIINNYGENQTNSKISSIQFLNLGGINTQKIPEHFKLYSRSSNADSIDEWTNDIALGEAYDASAEALLFNADEINGFGQFFVTNENILLPPEDENQNEEAHNTNPQEDIVIDETEEALLEEFAAQEIEINDEKISAPKPYVKNKEVSFPNLNEDFKITIYSMSGKEVLKLTVVDGLVSMQDYASGIYLYWIETNDRLLSGKFLVD